MSEAAHIALSANGYENVELAHNYGSWFNSYGREAKWTLPPELSAEVSRGRMNLYVRDQIRSPQQASRRLEVIQGAAALVVVSAVEEKNSHFGTFGQDDRRIWTPGQESQLDMALAVGAGTPVFMPEGLPELSKQDEEDNNTPLASPERLRAMGVLTIEETPQHGYPSDRVAFILHALQSGSGEA